MNFQIKKSFSAKTKLALVPWFFFAVVLLVGLGITTILWCHAQQQQANQLHSEFEDVANQARQNIRSRLKSYEIVMQGVKGFFESSEHASPDEFRVYVQDLKLQENQFGLQGVGLVKLVSYANKKSHVAEIRKQGLPNYQITPAGVRDYYAPIIRIEPLTGSNLNALGYDILVVPSALAALEQSRDTGNTTITSSLTLVQDANKADKDACVMYLPIYQKDKKIDTLAERQAAIVEWVDLPFRMGDLMDGLHGEFDKDINIEIYDGVSPSEQVRIYPSKDKPIIAGVAKSLLQSSRTIDIGGRQWTLLITSTPAFSARLSDSYLPIVIVSTGIVLTLTLSWLAWLLTKGKITAQSRYRQLFDQSGDGVLVLNREHRLIDANTAALQSLGYTREALLKLRLPDILAKHELPRLDTAVNKMMAGKPHREEWVYMRKDGSEFPAEVSASKLGVGSYFGIFRDLTEHKKAAQRIQRLTRLYQALSETNQAIVRMSNEVDLFPMVCKCTVDYGDMKMAWIGQLDESNSSIIKASAYGAGLEYLDSLIISSNPDVPEGQGPTATALRENRTVIVNNYLANFSTRPWHVLAEKFGWKSAGVFPIQRNSKPFAVLTVYSDKLYAFDKEAIHLLNEMATDISFALDNFDRETQRQHSLKKLAENEAQLALILENVGAYIYLKDSEGRYLFANRKILDLWGETLEQVIGFGDEKFFDAHTVEKIRENDRLVLVEGKIVEEEETNTVQKTGKTATYWSVKLPLRREDGSLYGLCGISTDITEHKAAEERIRVLSNFDSLTQLPNRNLLFDRAQQALTIAKRANDKVILMYLDIDRFKIINDSLGLCAGDQILKELSVRLNKHLYQEDTLCRPGGDEFILLLPNTDVEGAAHVAKKIFDICAQPFCIAGQRVSLTVSIGVAEFPQDGDSFEQLSQSANAALSRAKQNGRNNFQFFTRQLHEQASRILRIENELYDAVEKGEFLLHYQPQVDVNTSKIIGAEVLVRWQHPQKGMVSPSEFIPIAEECGLITDIGDWVLHTAIRQVAAWQTAGLAIVPVAVNLSIVQFRQDTLYEKIAHALQQNGLAPAMLELEVTEGIAMENFERTIDVLNRLHQLGITLSIDDFGTGYSSLSYLKRFKVNKLKIDQSFIQDLCSNPEDEAIVTAIINMAKSLGFKTIAEGVETLDQLNFLREKNCDEIQGYYFSKPLPAEAFANMLCNGGAF